MLVGCDIAVHASQGEVGLCLAILEFMSAGLPSDVADEQSVCQCISNNETGLLFRSGSADDLGEKLLGLIDDAPLRSRIGAAARHAVNTDYNLRDTVASVVDAVTRVAV